MNTANASYAVRGRFILNTRPAIYRARTAAAFAGTGLPVVDWPLFTPHATARAWPAPDSFDAVLFTSQVAVAFAPPAWHGLTAYVVGKGTEAAALAAGFKLVIRTGQDAADMVQALQGAQFQRALYASGADITTDLAATFPGRVERLAVYEMAAEDRVPETVVERIEKGGAIAPLFSRQTGRELARQLTGAQVDLGSIDAIGMSANVFDPPNIWRREIVAKAPTLDGIAQAVTDLIRAESS